MLKHFGTERRVRNGTQPNAQTSVSPMSALGHELFDVGIAAECNDTLAFNRQRLHCGEPIIDGSNFSVRKNQISRLGGSCNGPNHSKRNND